MERWKPMASDSQYSISDAGSVIGPKGPRKHTFHSAGYPILNLKKNGQFYVHRLVAELFIGPCPEGLQVNHKNGDKADNRVENLEYVTRSQNIQHSYRVLGRPIVAVRGEDHPNSKLTNADVASVHAMFANGIKKAHIAKHFGVSRNHIGRLVNHKVIRTLARQ